MSQNLVGILDSLGKALLESPFLAVMIVDQDLNIIWHNEAYARDLGVENCVGQKCYEVTSSDKAHAGCPTQITLKKGNYTRAFYDFGETNGLFFTIPLPDGLAAKVHTFLPKEATGEIKEA